MVLTIISHTPHYRIERDIYSWGPTSRELNYFSKIFTEIYHIAPLHSGKATNVYVKYESANIKFIPAFFLIGLHLYNMKYCQCESNECC